MSGRMFALRSESAKPSSSGERPYFPSLITARPLSLWAKSHHLWEQTSKRAFCQVVFLWVSLFMNPADVSHTSSLEMNGVLKSALSRRCFSCQEASSSHSMSGDEEKSLTFSFSVLFPPGVLSSA